MIPLRCRLFPVADDPDYTTPWLLNLDFARLAGNKSIVKSCVGIMSFFDMEKVERCSWTVLGGHSQSFWSLSALLAHLADEVASGLWSPEEADLLISARELLAVEKGLLQFCHLISGSTVAVFVDNSTAVAYLRKQGGTRSSVLNPIAQQIFCLAEEFRNVLALQFIVGKNNVLVDFLSQPNQVQGLDWILRLEVFQDLLKKWPVMTDLFAASLTHCCSLYFSPFHNLRSLRMDALLQN